MDCRRPEHAGTAAVVRLLVCTDRIGALASSDAGAALGRAFVTARPGVEVAVVPMAAGGDDLVTVLAELGSDATVVSAPCPVAPGTAGIDVWSTTLELGNRLAAALASRPRQIIVDLTGVQTHDGGAGILAALGARSDVALDAGVGGLAGLSRLDLEPARRLVGDTELVAVVDVGEMGDLLLGLRGLTARRGHATGADPALMLATDASLGALAGLLCVPDGPGMGAAGGAVVALSALSAWQTTGPALCAQFASLETTALAADVIVTGTDGLDFVRRGGPVVGEVIAVAERTLRPCVVVARTVGVSSRELRTFGVEVAYPIGGTADLTAADLTERASGVASSWTW